MRKRSLGLVHARPARAKLISISTSLSVPYKYLYLFLETAYPGESPVCIPNFAPERTRRILISERASFLPFELFYYVYARVYTLIRTDERHVLRRETSKVAQALEIKNMRLCHLFCMKWHCMSIQRNNSIEKKIFVIKIDIFLDTFA